MEAVGQGRETSSTTTSVLDISFREYSQVCMGPICNLHSFPLVCLLCFDSDHCSHGKHINNGERETERERERERERDREREREGEKERQRQRERKREREIERGRERRERERGRDRKKENVITRDQRRPITLVSLYRSASSGRTQVLK